MSKDLTPLANRIIEEKKQPITKRLPGSYYKPPPSTTNAMETPAKDTVTTNDTS